LNVFLRGNHEDIILKLLDGETGYWYTWLEQGEGRACVNSYGIDPDRFRFQGEHYVFFCGDSPVPLDDKVGTIRAITHVFPAMHLQFMKDTVLTFQTDEYFVSHAGIESGLSLNDQALFTDQFIVWGDEDFLYDERNYGKTVVFGHYHWKEPYIGVRKVGLAIQDDVSLFDLASRVIIDSPGRKIPCEL
jgi:serine/threonine protein phosphatase 1